MSRARVPITTDNAVLLLAAVEELGLDPHMVRTTSDGVFEAPSEVVDKAFEKREDPAPEPAAHSSKPPAKKAAKSRSQP